jgi:hypothetical protein
LYGFLGVLLADYKAFAKPLSAAWDTLAMPVAKFREVAAAVDDYFHATPPIGLANAHAAPCFAWDDAFAPPEVTL